ncbi:MAG: hypothetical protein M3O22_03650 [Pseudomonadota bacterium]|nr:hypothetical protein [Pseudomonadota bacterium]
MPDDKYLSAYKQIVAFLEAGEGAVPPADVIFLATAEAFFLPGESDEDTPDRQGILLPLSALVQDDRDRRDSVVAAMKAHFLACLAFFIAREQLPGVFSPELEWAVEFQKNRGKADYFSPIVAEAAGLAFSHIRTGEAAALFTARLYCLLTQNPFVRDALPEQTESLCTFVLENGTLGDIGLMTAHLDPFDPENRQTYEKMLLALQKFNGKMPPAQPVPEDTLQQVNSILTAFCDLSKTPGSGKERASLRANLKRVVDEALKAGNLRALGAVWGAVIYHSRDLEAAQEARAETAWAELLRRAEPRH